MFRGLLILTSTVVAVIAMLIGVVGFGLHKIAAAQREADASWHPPEAETPTTRPSVEPIMASDTQDPALQQNTSIELWAKDATLHGNVQLSEGKGKVDAKRQDPPQDERAMKRWKIRRDMGGHPVTTYISGFNQPDEDYAEWAIELPKAGDYEIDVAYAAGWNAGGHFVLAIADKELRSTVLSTKYETNFRVTTVGKLTLPAGKTTLTLRSVPKSERDKLVMNVRSIQIIPSTD